MIAAISMSHKSKKYNDKGNNTKCSYCEYSRHTSKQNCPAQGKTWKLCGKKNHFEEKSLRIVIPKALQCKIIENLHSANQGTTSMLARARQCVYWPSIDDDINKHVLSCDLCRQISPSQQKEPLIMTSPPDYPFQKVVSDTFEESGYKYLAYANRLTGFVELTYFPTNTSSNAIIKTIREFFQRWGIAQEISADGGPNLSSPEIKEWLESWGVKLRLSPAYYPKSNRRTEAAVKSLKRLLKGNTERSAINNDKIAKAFLQQCNTPFRDIQLNLH